jgi:hypothetical protein
VANTWKRKCRGVDYGAKKGWGGNIRRKKTKIIEHRTSSLPPPEIAVK